MMKEVYDRPKFFTHCPVCNAETPPGTIHCPNCGVDLEIARANFIKDATLAAGKYGFEVGRQTAPPPEPVPITPINKENNAYAFGSIIFGLFSWVAWLFPVCGFPVAGIGISLGTMGLKSARRNLAIVGIVFSTLGFLAVTMNSAVGAYLGYTGELFSPAPSPRATATSYRPPTITPAFGTVVPLPTSHAANCLLWSQVSSQMEGRTVCVYGTVIEYRENWENFISNIYFGTHDQFYIVSNYRWNDSPKGDCVSATGEVQLNTYKVPYIKIEDKIDSCP